MAAKSNTQPKKNIGQEKKAPAKKKQSKEIINTGSWNIFFSEIARKN